MSFSFLPNVYAGTAATAATILPLAGTVLTGIRFVVRTRGQNELGADDWLVAAANVCVWAMAAVILRGISRGILGYPTPVFPDSVDNLQPPLIQENSLLQYIFWIPMILAFGFIKIAVVWFYRRIFVITHGTFDVCTLVILAACVAWTVASFFLTIFNCGSNVDFFWLYLVDPPGTCLNALNLYLGIGASDLATDLLVFFLPIPIVARLHMPVKKKLNVTLMIALGGISLIASAFRLALFAEQLSVGYAVNIDVFLLNTLLLYWSMLEAGLALIAINLPMLGQFMGIGSVRSVIGSVRGVFSLHSQRSKQSLDSEKGRTGMRRDTTHADAWASRGPSTVDPEAA